MHCKTWGFKLGCSEAVSLARPIVLFRFFFRAAISVCVALCQSTAVIVEFRHNPVSRHHQKMRLGELHV